MDAILTDDLPEAVGYTLNAFDCPVCGGQTATDADFGGVEVCEDCGERVRVL